jgi:hypothetical protein
VKNQAELFRSGKKKYEHMKQEYGMGEEEKKKQIELRYIKEEKQIAIFVA